MGNPQIKAFCDNYSLRSTIKQPKCYKSPTDPTCIDLILTNTPQNFQSTCLLETGLSDFHLMTLTVMKKVFKKMKLSIFKLGILNYRSHKHFSNEAFRTSLSNKLSKEVFVTNDDRLQRFCCINILLVILFTFSIKFTYSLHK